MDKRMRMMKFMWIYVCNPKIFIVCKGKIVIYAVTFFVDLTLHSFFSKSEIIYTHTHIHTYTVEGF